MSKRWILLVLVIVMALAACGDDDSPFVAPDSGGGAVTGGDGQGTPPTASGGGGGDSTTAPPTTVGELTGQAEIALSQTIADGLLEGMADVETDLDILGPAEARCIGDGVVLAVGAARLRELGLRPGASLEDVELDLDNVAESEILAIAGVALDCLDLRPLLLDALAQAGISANSANCLADELLDTGILNDLLGTLVTAAGEGGDLAGLAENPEIIGTVMSLLSSCLTPEELGVLLGEMGGLGGEG